MTFFYLTNFSYVKTVLTIWSVSQFAIFKNRYVFADPITYNSSIKRKFWGRDGGELSQRKEESFLPSDTVFSVKTCQLR